ncbi:MAG: OadG family protein [Lachnospiraceae bacterium]|nr:OadG family protein [Lachnospiraceae bacterium]
MISYYLVAMFGNEVSIGDSLFISVFAMLVVFTVLVAISYLVDLTAFFINKKPTKKIVVETATSVDNQPNKSSDELVAIIAAAISSYLDKDTSQFRIKKIRRIPQNDSPWTKRGLLSLINNTK